MVGEEKRSGRIFAFKGIVLQGEDGLRYLWIERNYVNDFLIVLIFFVASWFLN
jgi:hypothetical protein